MFRIVSALFLLALGAGCSSVSPGEVPLPRFVAGITYDAIRTKWTRNWCSGGGQPVKNLEPTCLQIHGAFSIISVEGAVNLEDLRPIAPFDILVNASILSNRPINMVFEVEPAPADMAADTGVRYLAIKRHFVREECPNLDERDRFSKTCLSLLQRSYAGK